MSTRSKLSSGNGKKTIDPAEPLSPSVLEKALIASAAAKSGCKGLADFIRTTVLDRAHGLVRHADTAPRS